MAVLEKEAQQNELVLFLISLDKQVKQSNVPWAVDLRRTRHFGDFSRWKDQNAYQQAFKRLLLDLRSHGRPESRTNREYAIKVLHCAPTDGSTLAAKARSPSISLRSSH